MAAGKGGGALGIERISQLETQLASISVTCSQLHENVAELEKQNTSLQEEINRLTVIKYVSNAIAYSNKFSYFPVKSWRKN